MQSIQNGNGDVGIYAEEMYETRYDGEERYDKYFKRGRRVDGWIRQLLKQEGVDSGDKGRHKGGLRKGREEDGVQRKEKIVNNVK